MRTAIALTCLVLISCQSAPTTNERFPDAQALVEGRAAQAPNIVPGTYSRADRYAANFRSGTLE